MTELHRVLLAEHSSPWRSALLDGLKATGAEVTVTDSGEELRRALTAGDGFSCAIIGELLRETTGADALYLAGVALEREGRARPSWPVQRILLITEVRHDPDLLELFRRRGVDAFLRRDDSIERTLAEITNSLFAAERGDPRHAVRIDASLAGPGFESPALIEDLSLTGARVVLARSALSVEPTTGMRLDLAFGFQGAVVRAGIRLRNVHVRTTFFGDRWVMGCSFEDISDEARRTLSRIVVFAARELEMAARG